MVHQRIVDDQLKAIGANFRFLGHPEVRELSNILMPGEVISQAMNGFYENGFAFLCVTNHRLLLVDKKPLFLTLEDIRFDMISEVDFNHQMINATLRVHTPNKSLKFTTWSHGRLRQLSHIVQEHVIETRQMSQQTPQQQFAQFAQAQITQPASSHIDHEISLAPALAHTAIQGASTEESSSALSFMSNNFKAPLSRNPYLQTPLKTYKKFRNF